MNTNPLIFHIDVNSAYLSWTAVHELELGRTEDIRLIPSAIGGNRETATESFSPSLHPQRPAASVPVNLWSLL